VEFYKRWDQLMLDIYVGRMAAQGTFSSDRTPREIRFMLEEQMGKHVDVFLTAEETIEWGLADEIFDGNWEGLV